ncbi:PAS domain-containing protein [Pelagibaca abyssi]|nr:PAS domain-containing protein [Salipiger abyssi]
MLGTGGNGRGIVSMTDREKQKRLAPVRLLESYWHGLVGETGAVPLRSQIDPRGIESALEYAFLAERIAPTLAKLRVAGTHLNDLMGMETAGMPLSALFAPSARETLADAVAQVFSEGAAARIELRAEEGFGKGAMAGHLLLLPLRSDMGDMSRMIGVLTTSGRIGRTPRRFTIDTVDLKPALRGAVAPVPSMPEPLPPRETELSEPRAEFTPAPKPEGRKHPYLRLIVSND